MTDETKDSRRGFLRAALGVGATVGALATGKLSLEGLKHWRKPTPDQVVIRNCKFDNNVDRVEIFDNWHKSVTYSRADVLGGSGASMCWFRIR